MQETPDGEETINTPALARPLTGLCPLKSHLDTKGLTKWTPGLEAGWSERRRRNRE